MHWIAPTEKGAANAALEKGLWDAANQFWAGANKAVRDALLRLFD